MRPSVAPLLRPPPGGGGLSPARTRSAWSPPPTNTVPVDAKSLAPEDMPKFLPDEAIRGSMAMLYNEIIGPDDATFSFGGPNFLDVHGFFLD